MNKAVPSRQLLVAALSLAGLVWLMSLAYGFQHLVAGDSAKHTAYFRIATVLFAGLVAYLTWFAATRAPYEGTEAVRPPWWLGLAMMTASFGLTCFFYSPMLAPMGWMPPVAAVPLIALVVHRRWGYRGANAVFLLAIGVLFVYVISRFPHDSAGDMLQIIDFASNDLLRGENPYRHYFTSAKRDVPFVYWPVLWLPYVPLIAAGVDLRVLNLLVFVLLTLLFFRVAGGGERGAEALALVVLPFLLSSQVFQMVVWGHSWVYWLLVTALLVLLVRRQFLAAAVVFGLCLATRPTALFLAGPIVAFLWSREGVGWVLRGGAVSAAVVVAIHVPFVVAFGDGFVNNTYSILLGVNQELKHFSLLAFLKDAGLGALGNLVQVVITLALMYVIVRKRSLAPDQFVMLAGLAYFWMILFAPYATRYVYFPAYLLVALGLLISYRRETVAATSVEESPAGRSTAWATVSDDAIRRS